MFSVGPPADAGLSYPGAHQIELLGGDAETLAHGLALEQVHDLRSPHASSQDAEQIEEGVRDLLGGADAPVRHPVRNAIAAVRRRAEDGVNVRRVRVDAGRHDDDVLRLQRRILFEQVA